MNDVENCERSNTFANADERWLQINVNVQNSIHINLVLI
jgi:hypothetical protein